MDNDIDTSKDIESINEIYQIYLKCQQNPNFDMNLSDIENNEFINIIRLKYKLIYDHYFYIIMYMFSERLNKIALDEFFRWYKINRFKKISELSAKYWYFNQINNKNIKKDIKELKLIEQKMIKTAQSNVDKVEHDMKAKIKENIKGCRNGLIDLIKNKNI